MLKERIRMDKCIVKLKVEDIVAANMKLKKKKLIITKNSGKIKNMRRILPHI